MSNPDLGFAALGIVFVALLTGFPMAFVFIFVALVFGYVGIHAQIFYLFMYKTFGLMGNTLLAAIPLFLFMGYILEQSRLMEGMFLSLRRLMAPIPGALYIVVLIVATIFAAATGVVGASVTVLGVMAAPVMIESGYDTRLSAGAIAAGGTLGILIPPSVMLIVMGPTFGVPVSELFTAAIVPGLVLAGSYVVFALIQSFRDPRKGPPLESDQGGSLLAKLRDVLIGVVPVMVILVATLGAIITGVTTPTDAAATGAFASLLLAIMYGRFSWRQFAYCVRMTMETTSMIMFLILSANFFGAVFARLGSAHVLTETLLHLQIPSGLIVTMILFLVFLLGGPLEWIPIVIVVVPIFIPTIHHLGYNEVWFAILVAVTLQTSWLTPPMALSSFFLKGVVPQWKMSDIYWGMLPFVGLQLLVVAVLVVFPGLVMWLPNLTGGG